VGAEELRERKAVGVVRLHADRQRLGAAQHQKRVERAEDRPFRVLDELQPLDVVVARRDDDPADAVAMAVEVLGRAVRDEVGAELDRALQVRTGEGVVDDQTSVVAVGEVGRRPQVGDAHHGVGRRLDEQHPRRRRHRPFDLVEVRRVDIGEGQLVPPQHLVEQPERAAVGIVRHHHVIAGLQHGRNRADRSHP
jgi:hypothetical protein